MEERAPTFGGIERALSISALSIVCPPSTSGDCNDRVVTLWWRLIATGHALHEHHLVAAVRLVPGNAGHDPGGSPASTGIYDDVVWDDKLSPAADTNCVTRGAIVAFDGQANVDDTVVEAVLDPAKLPRHPERGCVPLYPPSFVRVNTIFEVIKAHGERTAASDKHPSCKLLNGPSGTGIGEHRREGRGHAMRGHVDRRAHRRVGPQTDRAVCQVY